MIYFHRLCLYAFPLQKVPSALPPRLKVEFIPVQKGDRTAEQVTKAQDQTLAEQRFDRGEICFVALHQGEVVSYCWLSQGEVGIEEVDLSVQPQPDEVYLYNAMTLKPWRGQGLYPALLGEIASYAQDESLSRALIFVSSTNRASRRGVIKAGFIEFQVVTYLSVLGLPFYWQSEPSDDQRAVVLTRL